MAGHAVNAYCAPIIAPDAACTKTSASNALPSAPAAGIEYAVELAETTRCAAAADSSASIR